ncbi:MAG: MerR family transcriptional regulator [Aestuariivirgaceae bacterium]
MQEPILEADEESPRPAKSPEAFRTISEVAETLNVPQHVLRFWETRFSQIRPMKRGGGRRFYRPVDVDLLKGIRHLLYGQGYTIRGVQRILKENGTAHVVEIGRGTVRVGEPQVEANEPRSIAIAPRKPRIITAGDTGQSPHSGRSRQAMTTEQVASLREALADLLWARRILSGTGNSH